MAFRYRFKTEAEDLAAEQRRELGIQLIERLDPMLLAQHLAIDVWPLSWLPEQARARDGVVEAVALLSGTAASTLSAFTVFRGPQRVIVHNDAHPPSRQVSNLAHELSHGLILHPATPVLDHRGCRNWNPDLEDEASYLAGALLIPGSAARWVAKRKMNFTEAADHFGCSVDMVRYRVNVSGGRRLMAS